MANGHLTGRLAIPLEQIRDVLDADRCIERLVDRQVGRAAALLQAVAGFQPEATVRRGLAGGDSQGIFHSAQKGRPAFCRAARAARAKPI